MRVPQVSAEDVRAYMYSLFVRKYAPHKLSDVQETLLHSLQNSWSGKSFERKDINKLADSPADLLDALAVSDRLAPILANAPTINGNPRIIKRLLNSIILRQALAVSRRMNVDLATLAKLAVFERSTDSKASQRLYPLVMEEKDADQFLLPASKLKGKRPDVPSEWKNYEGFIDSWREMEPHFEDVVALRPAVFLSRDVMAPSMSRAGLSDAASEAITALLGVNSVNSPAAKKIVGGLTPADQRAVMGEMVAHLRQQDWSKSPPRYSRRNIIG